MVLEQGEGEGGGRKVQQEMEGVEREKAKMVIHSTSRPSEVSAKPMTAPARKATRKPWPTPRRASSAVRALAKTAISMPR